MPKLIAVINVSGDDRYIAATGELVAAGATARVDGDLAGRPPSGDPDSDSFDPGEGLLAQPANWQPATAAAATTQEGDA